MDNKWAEPEGVENVPTPIRYRIWDRKKEEVVVRTTLFARDIKRKFYYFQSLALEDQVFANEIVELVQQACTYFYASDEAYEPMEGVPDIRITDEEVIERIRRLNLGENQREADRTHRLSYPIDELPWDQQRALIERIDQHKIDNKFEIIGPNEITRPPDGEPDVGYESDVGEPVATESVEYGTYETDYYGYA